MKKGTQLILMNFMLIEPFGNFHHFENGIKKLICLPRKLKRFQFNSNHKSYQILHPKYSKASDYRKKAVLKQNVKNRKCSFFQEESTILICYSTIIDKNN